MSVSLNHCSHLTVDANVLYKQIAMNTNWYDCSITRDYMSVPEITMNGRIDEEKLNMITTSNMPKSEVVQSTYSCTFGGPSSAISISSSLPSNTVKLDIKRVIHNAPATVILWNDGTKTVVKAHNEPFDPEKGFAMAVCKKLLGDSYKKTFREYCGKEENK